MNKKRGFLRLFLVVYYSAIVAVFSFDLGAQYHRHGQSTKEQNTVLIVLAVALPAVFWIRKGFKSDKGES